MEPLSYILNLASVRVIIEVGCDWLVETTPLYRKAYPEARIVSVDADPAHALTIRENHSDAKLKVEFVHTALGDRTGEAVLWKSSDRGLSSSILQPTKYHPEGGGVQWQDAPVIVPITTLDYLCKDRKIDRIDILHMDVQGAEHLVLAGAPDALKRCRYIMAEHNTAGAYKGASTLEILKAMLANWRAVAVGPYDVAFVNESLCHEPWLR